MGQPGQTIGHPGNRGGADHLCIRRDIFRASMLVEALLVLVELSAGSGYESRAVWTGGFENCCLLSPGETMWMRWGVMNTRERNCLLNWGIKLR